VRPKAPKEDPRIKSAREAEERRADAAFLETNAALLDEEMRRRIRRVGSRSRARAAARGAGSPRAGAPAGYGTGGSYDPIGGQTGGGSGSSSTNGNSRNGLVNLV
jgi:hypothetical protein